MIRNDGVQPLVEEILKTRRGFLKSGSLVLGALTAGTVTPVNATTTVTGSKIAGFGWEIGNIANNSANVFFRVRQGMILQWVDIDVTFMITSAPAVSGFAEVLCRAGVSRGARPSFSGPPQDSIVFPASQDFGAVQVHNPNNLSLGFDGVLLQDAFYQVILKSWVPVNGTASSTSRNAHVAPDLVLSTGDFLVFHMAHGGVPGDAEMQVTMSYVLV
jgi:hypothetical protein